MSGPRGPSRLQRPTIEALVEGVLAGDRAALGRAITVVESQREADQARAGELLSRLRSGAGAGSGSTLRVGITGVPGVGKSTFIETLGRRLTAAGTRVAVLAVDPSSTRTGGSILGDKTRMQELARDPLAFVRPTPTRGSLGGVARRTREVMQLCEAAGYEVVLVETVGVGQSETVVAGMVDFFLVLMLAGAGDELQGIKRGILELADMVAVNKADGDNLRAAQRARVDYATALHLMPQKSAHWRVPVRICSGLEGEGVGELWAEIEAYREALEAAGEWARDRAQQRVAAMWRAVEWGLMAAFHSHPGVRGRSGELEDRVRAGSLGPDDAARALLASFRDRGGPG